MSLLSLKPSRESEWERGSKKIIPGRLLWIQESETLNFQQKSNCKLREREGEKETEIELLSRCFGVEKGILTLDNKKPFFVGKYGREKRHITQRLQANVSEQAAAASFFLLMKYSVGKEEQILFPLRVTIQCGKTTLQKLWFFPPPLGEKIFSPRERENARHKTIHVKLGE